MNRRGYVMLFLFFSMLFQVAIQKVLIIVGVACIPWMLFPKPIIMKLQHDKKVKKVSYFPSCRLCAQCTFDNLD